MGEIFKRERPSWPLHFTGERLTSDIGGQIELEHLHRYFLAREFCRDRNVLDVACGEGYGSAYLSQVAATVVGVDIDASTVDHAKANYGRANITFRTGSALEIPVEPASVDVVVSFETIEHFYDHDRFLTEVKRVLRPGGLFIVSTPERDIYSPVEQAANPFHVHEMTRDEFETLMGKHFANFGLLLQRVMLGSVLAPEKWPGQKNEVLTIERRGDEQFEISRGMPRAPYLIALASDLALPDMASSFYIETGYARLNDDRLREKDAELERQRSDLAAAEVELTAAEVELTAAKVELTAAKVELTAAAKVELTASLKEIDHLSELKKNLEGEIARTDSLLKSTSQALAHMTSKAQKEIALAQLASAQEVTLIRQEINRLSEESSRHAQERDSIANSTMWRITLPLRSVGAKIPFGLRRFTRRVLRGMRRAANFSRV